MSKYSLLTEDQKESRRAAHRRWMERNPGKRKEYYKTYDQDRYESRLEYNRKYREKHPDKFKEYNRANYLKNKNNFTPKTAEQLLLNASRYRSNKKGIINTISIIDIIIPEFCPIFPNIKLEKGITKVLDSSPTLDRIRPELGYIPGNVAVISHRANTIKSSGTAEEHRLIAKWIEENS